MKKQRDKLFLRFVPAAGPEREPGRRHKALLLRFRRAYGRRCTGAGGGKAGERPAFIRPHQSRRPKAD